MTRDTPTTLELKADMDGAEWPVSWTWNMEGLDMIAERTAVRFLDRNSYFGCNRRMFAEVKSAIAIALVEATQLKQIEVIRDWQGYITGALSETSFIESIESGKKETRVRINIPDWLKAHGYSQYGDGTWNCADRYVDAEELLKEFIAELKADSPPKDDPLVK